MPLTVNIAICILQLFLVSLAHAWLYSSGTEILSTTTHAPVRLRCINWYDAQMETFVSGGLDKRSCGAIAENIAEIGAN
jgi:hypothetical protein